MNNSTYSISSVAIDDNLLLDFSQRLHSLNMKYDFINYVFPVIYIDAFLTIDEFNALETSKNLRIKLSLRKINNVNPVNKAINAFDYCFRDIVFKVVDKNNKYIKNSNNEYENQSNLIKTRFVLMQEQDLNSNKVNCTGSFNNCTMKALINHLINNKLLQDKKTIFANPSNTNVFPQILLPYNNVINSIKYLDNVYGIYSDGLKIFFDLDKNYILNKNHNEFEQSGLYENIIIDIANSENVMTTDLLPNTITVLQGDFSYNELSNIKYEVTGTDNSFVLNNNKTILNKKWENDNTKSQVYYQKYNNPYVRNQINPEIDNFITAICRNADYDLINFINEYSIKEYNNSNFKDMSFNLVKYNHVFKKTSNNLFELVSSLYLRKI